MSESTLLGVYTIKSSKYGWYVCSSLNGIFNDVKAILCDVKSWNKNDMCILTCMHVDSCMRPLLFGIIAKLPAIHGLCHDFVCLGALMCGGLDRHN